MKIKFQKKYLISRKEADTLKREILDCGKKIIILDFSEVIFFSRSFADELINLIEELKKKKVLIKLCGANDSLKKLFKIVSRQRQAIQKEIKR